MTDLVTMKTRITNELRRADLSDEASQAIVSAVRFYEHESFWFNEAGTAFATTSITSLYSVPSDFYGLKSQVIKINVNSNFVKKIEAASYKELDEWDSNPSSKAIPCHYALHHRGGSTWFRLYPFPDTAYTLSYQYIQQLNASLSNSSSGAWFSTAEEMIRMHAKKDLLVNTIRGQEATQYAVAISQLEAQAYDRLKQKDFMKKSGSNLRPSW